MQILKLFSPGCRIAPRDLRSNEAVLGETLTGMHAMEVVIVVASLGELAELLVDPHWRHEILNAASRGGVCSTLTFKVWPPDAPRAAENTARDPRHLETW